MNLYTKIHISARIFLVITCITTLPLTILSLNTWTNIKLACESNCSSLPPVLRILSFCGFAGGFGLVDAAIEVVLVIAHTGYWGIIVAADVLSATFLLAGGVALSVVIKKEKLDWWCYNVDSYAKGWANCSMVQADAAFLFLGLVAMLVVAGARIMGKRGGVKENGSNGGERHAALAL